MKLNSHMPFRAIKQLLMVLSISTLVACSASLTFDIDADGASSGELRTTSPEAVGTVSYTHLTLPTIYSV